jgi:hypothetical protein
MDFGSLAAIERTCTIVNKGKLRMLKESRQRPYAAQRDALNRLAVSFLEGARR